MVESGVSDSTYAQRRQRKLETGVLALSAEASRHGEPRGRSGGLQPQAGDAKPRGFRPPKSTGTDARRRGRRLES